VVRRLWPAWPLALLTLVVGLWWEYAALAGHHLLVYPLLGWLLPLLGLYGSLVFPLLVWRTARRTSYAVRTDGLVVRWGERPEQAWSVPAAVVPPAHLVPRRAGLSDVWLDGPGERASRWGWWQTSDERPILMCLRDGAAAQGALAQLRDGALDHGAAPGAWAATLATPAAAAAASTPAVSAAAAAAAAGRSSRWQ
jgi:hypothetical protein